jgi:hypothetical protein
MRAMLTKIVKALSGWMALLWPRTTLGREIAVAIVLKIVALALLYYFFVAPLLKPRESADALRDEFTSSRRR